MDEAFIHDEIPSASNPEDESGTIPVQKVDRDLEIKWIPDVPTFIHLSS